MLFNITSTGKIFPNVYAVKKQAVNFYLYQDGTLIL